MKRIILNPDEICEYWEEHKASLGYSPYKIAEYEERNVEVYISVTGDELQFIVTKGQDVCGEYTAYDPDDVEFIFETIEREDLSPLTPEDNFIDINEKIQQREDAISDFVDDFIYNLTDGDCGISAEETEKFKDFICGILYRDYGISVYRPMILEDEDGNKSFSEYPYEEIDLDYLTENAS